jgi:hypothetical protein
MKPSMRSLGRRCSKRLALPVAAATIALATPARAYHEGDERIVDQTAHTLRARETRIGLWAVELAPLAFATVGTDTAPWAASFLVHSVVANGHAKVRLLATSPLSISVTAAAYHADLDSAPVVATGGSLLVVPVSLFVSSDLSRRLSVHLGATYAYADLDGDLDLRIARAQVAVSASALQVHAMGEYRVSRLVALTLQVHAQAYATPPALRMSTTGAEKVDFVGTVQGVDRTAVAAVGSVVLSGRHVNFRIGGGYGAIFLSSMGIMIPVTTVLPELDAYVRF